MRHNELKLELQGLDCANCANKIERKVANLPQVKEAEVNFSMGTMLVQCKDGASREEVLKLVKGIVKDLEPDVIVEEISENASGNKKRKSNCSNGTCTVDNGHQHGKEKEERLSLKDKIFLALGIIFFILGFILGEGTTPSIISFLVSFIFAGTEIIIKALKNIFKGEIFDENFLMSVATIGAFAIGQYGEAVAVMLFYKIGEVCQSYAVNKSRKSISSLMDIRADYANLIIDGKEEKVSPEKVEVDDIIIIKPGERVPLDGVVVSGNSSLDTSALTGESIPRNVNENEEILAGTINLTGVITVKVTKEFGESTVARILDLVQNAGSKKAPTEKFITKFARYYTPIVVFSALALAIIPPIFVQGAEFSDWLYRALIFLVVSCPCALVISVPLSLFAGIGGASKKGILIKGGNYLEALKNVETVVFDKTGTLTKGIFKVSKINNVNIEEDELLKIAAYGESFSSHPIAKSIVEAYGKTIDKSKVKDYEEVAGNGIKAVIEGKVVLLGNKKLMNKFNIEFTEENELGTVVYASIDNEYKGSILIADEVKSDSKEAIRSLKKLGVKKAVMLTGDSSKIADKVAGELGITEVYSELLPGDKVDKVEMLLSSKSKDGKLVFVGDGINDAPVLARADIGVAMGAMGSDAAIEAADVVLMKDEPSSLAEAVKIAKKTNKILWQNIIFSLSIKVVVLILSAIGIANMWEGVFADVGVTLLAVLNSMRALNN